MTRCTPRTHEETKTQRALASGMPCASLIAQVNGLVRTQFKQQTLLQLPYDRNLFGSRNPKVQVFKQ